MKPGPKLVEGWVGSSNCSLATHGDICRIVITRFCEDDEVTPIFRTHLEKMLADEGEHLVIDRLYAGL